jgi:hypothetical protein
MQCFEYLVNTVNHKDTIFVHNLRFDAVYIYRGLNYVFEALRAQGHIEAFKACNLDQLIDDNSTFVQIVAYFPQTYLKSLYTHTTLTGGACAQSGVRTTKAALKPIRLVFKDSNRIFPLSLDKLCLMFGVPGKVGKYNKAHNTYGFHNDSALLKSFIHYAEMDVICMQSALLVAQKEYLSKYSVDITSAFSTSSLCLKIYRTHFQNNKINIPILNTMQDSYIRNSYVGGSTDVYARYAENLYYYDINSLYPAAMLKPMPYRVLGYKESIPNLYKFFGFCYAKIECPINVFPLLPCKHEGKTIHPQGT